MRRTSDRFLPSRHKLRPLYDMGVHLGNFRLQASECLGLDREFPEAFPDIRSIAIRAMAIPSHFRSYSSTLASLAEIVPLLGKDSHPLQLCKFYSDHKDTWSYRGAIEEPMSIVFMADDLVERIQNDLAVVADSDWEIGEGLSNIPGSISSCKPRWYKEVRELRVKDLAIHSFSGAARRQTFLLDLFEDAGWPEKPETIRVPVEERAYLDQTLRDLRKRTNSYLTFHRKGDRVYWEWARDPQNF